MLSQECSRVICESCSYFGKRFTMVIIHLVIFCECNLRSNETNYTDVSEYLLKPDETSKRKLTV